jgi:predicted ATPase
MNHYQLSQLVINGFKSIRECDLKLNAMNVLIGPNGVGKSNFIVFFKLIQQMLDQNLQTYVSKQGGPDAILHFGRKTTEQLSAALYFGNNGYKFTLEPTQDNRMMYAREALWWNMKGDQFVGSGHFESQAEKDRSLIKQYTLPAMKSWRIFHFHDTSDSASVKGVQKINDVEYLRPDARNLAPFLLMLREQHPDNYKQVLRVVRLIAPFFGDFFLKPTPGNKDTIELQWTEKGEDVPFKAHQLSDGTLRFICLATVLCQPEDLQPETILIDEPELGLHPFAITLLASLLRSVSKNKQVIVSTQSVALVNEFEIGDLIVAERVDRSSAFKRLDEDDFKSWLEEYSLGELWAKNILGGRPTK